MIGQLKGIVSEKNPPFILIDVQGVGYDLQVSMNTFYHVPEVGQSIALYTHLIVREDALLLYGFHQKAERTLFRELIKVSGVGAKTALAILSSMDPQSFIVAIQQQEVSYLLSIPGIGRKTAERLIVEMKDRLSDWTTSSGAVSVDAITGDATMGSRDPAKDAISALISLGYKPQDASRAIHKLMHQNLSTENLIKEALKQMR
ncbi:MAG: Holliday junction DNA helicase RuvA [Gammaproteobacteria bacterium GWE2_42_36]|nr:MAG: Holliday junction DNA helicase RuvA [Gammaproteobacteria bacterium GWE2_42_36]HCU05117.1 Holliday junction branch migration protein RuvA [Coxiellaceae bacterium]